MAPSRRKGGGKAAAVAAACRQWKVGDLVLAKVKGFPAWPAAVSEPEKWGYSNDWKKVLVHFFGTQQIAFCNPADVEAFTEEKKQSLLTKRHAKGSDFVRAIKEITESYEKLKQQEQAVDPKSAEDTTLGSAGNTSLLPQVSENPTGTCLTQMKSDPSHGRDESILLNEDASAAEQMLALRDNSLTRSKTCDSAVVKESLKIATYSSRRRIGGTRSQKCAPQKKTCLVQRSKSSSRLQKDNHQSTMLQYSDGGQSINNMEDGALRRKRIRRSSGHFESDDVVSSALNSHGSDEENASEIAAAESDNNTRNEGNGADSGSNVEQIDTGGQLHGEYELNKGLNFQINTMVKRKKRKPTRKRGTSDSVDHPAKVEAEVVGDEARNSVQASLISHERFTERPSEENGDEHLPLVKRARVRMSREFYGNHEPNASSQVKERSSKDILVSAAQTSSSDIIYSHDTIAVEESKNFEVSAKDSDDNINVVPSPLEKSSDGDIPSVACGQTVGEREDAIAWKEVSKAPDDEAAGHQSNQISSSPAGEAQTASVLAAMCSWDSQLVKLPASDSSHSVVQCCQVVKVETSLDPSTVDSSANKVSGICSLSIPSQSSGEHRSQDQDACDSLENSHESLNEENIKNDACVAQVVQSEAIEHSPSSCLVVNKQETDNILLKEEDGSQGEEYAIVKPAQTTLNPHNSVTESDVIVDESEPLNETGYSKCEDAVEDNGQLKMICETDDQKHQVQTNNSVSVSENLSREKMSLSPANIGDTPVRGTPHSNSVYHISTAESENDIQNNSSCSPNVQSGEKKIVCDANAKEEEKIETGICQGQKVLSSDVQSTRESFEDALSSLVRTKESIGRATRLAMDLMKFGVPAKPLLLKGLGNNRLSFLVHLVDEEGAMEILAHTLESESNLKRRVDLFFLVDSIAQCSKGLKGDTGCLYLSAIQVSLPRLLAAAVPAGATTQENRTQCLKVLKLWLERRILPESIIRHHIRELDSHSIVPACLYSRRSARTERSLDDPVRDMEGMLVDEYGSNSTLQLPGFCMPAMLKDEEGWSDSEGGSDSDGGDFESVTPEHESKILEENVSSSTAERHTLILEDVDGELEMEDVAPAWETGNCTHTDQADNTMTTNCQPGQHHRPVFGTSHQHVSLSSPPLPSSSPPPPPPAPAPPSQQAQCAMSDSYFNGFENGGYSNMHGDQQAGPPRMNPPPSGNTMHYQGLDSSYSSSVQLTSSIPQADASNFQHRPYPSHPHPPPPPPLPPSQHQYSYTEPGHLMKLPRDAPSYSNRSHYAPNYEERNFPDNHERMRHAPYENQDNWRYRQSSCYGSRYQGKHKGPYPSSSYNGCPPRESGRFQNHRWNPPPHPYRDSFHPKPHSESPVPVRMRDPGMWHQRSD